MLFSGIFWEIDWRIKTADLEERLLPSKEHNLLPTCIFQLVVLNRTPIDKGAWARVFISCLWRHLQDLCHMQNDSSNEHNRTNIWIWLLSKSDRWGRPSLFHNPSQSWSILLLLVFVLWGYISMSQNAWTYRGLHCWQLPMFCIHWQSQFTNARNSWHCNVHAL